MFGVYANIESHVYVAAIPARIRFMIKIRFTLELFDDLTNLLDILLEKAVKLNYRNKCRRLIEEILSVFTKLQCSKVSCPMSTQRQVLGTNTARFSEFSPPWTRFGS